MADDGIGEDIKRAPKWVWIVAIGGGALVAFYVYTHRSSTPNIGGATTGANAGADLSGGLTDSATGVSSPMSNAQGFTSNQEWQNAAISEAGDFGSTPLAVQSATDTYLNGGTVTSAQGNLLNQIIGALGAAPLGSQGDVTVSAPPSSAPAPAGKVYPTFTPPPGDEIITGGSPDMKYLYNENSGKLIHGYTIPQWEIMRQTYMNNIPITYVPDSEIVALGGKRG